MITEIDVGQIIVSNINKTLIILIGLMKFSYNIHIEFRAAILAQPANGKEYCVY